MKFHYVHYVSLEAAQINLDEARRRKKSTRGCRKLTLLKTIKQILPYHDNCCVITTTPQTVPSASSRKAASFSLTIIIALLLPIRGNCSCSFLLAKKDFCLLVFLFQLLFVVKVVLWIAMFFWENSFEVASFEVVSLLSTKVTTVVAKFYSIYWYLLQKYCNSLDTALKFFPLSYCKLWK